jgi:hypothetical protein
MVANSTQQHQYVGGHTMRVREAKEIVLEAAINGLKGAGCGPGYSVPDGKDREQLKEAIHVLHKSLYGTKCELI